MSLIEELKATAAHAAEEVDTLGINLSEAVEKLDELMQLSATDFAESSNEDAQAFGEQINAARQSMQAVLAALHEAEVRIANYLRYLG